MPKILALTVLAFVLAAPALAKEKHLRPGPIRRTSSGEKWAEKTLRKMTLEEKVGQVFMIWCRASFLNMESPEYLQLRDAMQKYHLGSFSLDVPAGGPVPFPHDP